jgi:hypothetical protein
VTQGKDWTGDSARIAALKMQSVSTGKLTDAMGWLCHIRAVRLAEISRGDHTPATQNLEGRGHKCACTGGSPRAVTNGGLLSTIGT